MKKKQTKKLSLNKKAIVFLTEVSSKGIVRGGETATFLCTSTDPNICTKSVNITCNTTPRTTTIGG
jgi:hypothetical protein